ncbi:MAG: Flp pilus assembly protein CpaB [Firmicutes bacterium]|nr:Flp pilus assembly protein CpaB [Bacillota bacterium]MCL5039836.1 Flp pilus assembly protein CpaB [Bacillota bacterium]
MREKSFLWLALGISLLTGLYLYNYLLHLNRRLEVLVAVRDIPQFAIVEPGMLRGVALPAEAVHPAAVKRKEEVVGRPALHPISAGEQIISHRFSSEAGEAGLLQSLGPEERALLIPVNVSRAVGGMIRPGNRVDVILVADPQKTGTVLAQTILQSLLVLDVRGERGTSVGTARDNLLIGVVVSATAEEAEKLAFANEQGHLYLTLQGNQGRVTMTPGVSLGTLLEKAKLEARH